MSHIQQWITDLNKFDKLATSFSPVKVERHEKIYDLAELESELAKLGNITGWIQCTSEVLKLDNQKVNYQSIPMTGEWVEGETSYVLQYLGDHQWLYQQYVLIDCEAIEATHLAETILQLELGVKSKRKLIYKRLWEASSEENNAPIARTAVFSGFKE